ncbi:MAG: thioredoxin domain-containing protein [Cyanobacteria bacterium J06627_8]
MKLSANEQNFTSDVLDSPIPVLVNFWAPWCGLCKMLDPTLDRLQSQWGSRFRLISVNADTSLKLANMYRLKSLPTIMLFDRGQVRYRVDHFRNSDDIRRAFGDLDIVLEETMLSASSL